MKIVVNSESREISDGHTVLSLLDELGLRPEATVVERNAEIVDKRDYESLKVSNGDRFELVRFVGGG